jgi:hypothetical protein
MNTFPTHGISEGTPSNIPFGAGTWFKGLKYEEGTGWTGTVMGATSGGSSIKITNEIKDLEIDGVIVPVKGLALMAGGGGEAEVNFAELTPDIIKHTALAEVLDENSDGYVEGFDCFQTKGTIEDGDYVENLGFVGWTADKSKQIIVIMDYALGKGGLQLEPKNKENAVVKGAFTAYADMKKDLSRVPVRVYYTKDGAATA